MILSRRGFLIGTAGLLTAAFVKDALLFHSQRRAHPLLAPPPRSCRHTVGCSWRWDRTGEEVSRAWMGRLREVPWGPPPTWREFLKRADAKDYEREEFLEVLEEMEPDQLDGQMDEFWWQCHFQMVSGPIAKAHHLLDKIDLGPELAPESDGSHLKFEPDWAGPIFWDGLFIAASDMVAVSLLQARLIDLKLPIKVEEWKGW